MDANAKDAPWVPWLALAFSLTSALAGPARTAELTQSGPATCTPSPAPPAPQSPAQAPSPSPAATAWSTFVDEVEASVAKGDTLQAVALAKAKDAAAESAGDPSTNARYYRAVGNAYSGLASYGLSLANYERALELDRNNCNGDARYDLREIGILDTNLGRYQEALDHLNAALALDIKLPDAKAQGIELGCIGSVYSHEKQSAEALKYFLQALDLKKTTHDERGIAIDLGNIGRVYADAGNVPLAKRYLNEALAAKQRLEDIRGQGNDLSTIGDVEYRSGRYQSALDYYERALSIASHLSAREDIWYASTNIQLTLQRLGRPQEAVLFGKQAVNDIQSIRHEADTLSEPAGSVYVERKKWVYANLADLLIGLRRYAEAQQVLRMLKEEEFRGFDRTTKKDSSYGSALSYTPAEQDWATHYDELSKDLASEGVEFAGLQQIPADRRTETQRARFLQLQQDITNSYVEIGKFIQAVHQDYKSRSPNQLEQLASRNLESLRALQGHLDKMGHGAVAVHYLVTTTRVHMLMTMPQVQIHRSATIGERQLDDLIDQFRASLQSPYLDPRPAAARLYDVLVRPIVADLAKANAKTLMISLDGRLRQIPFAALYDGQRWLVEDYNVDVLTDAARSELVETPVPNWKVAAFGVSQSWQNLGALPSVPYELNGIVQNDGVAAASTGLLPGKIWLDDQFMASTFGDSLASHDFNVIHIASHFIFSPEGEAASYLVLGDGSRLSVANIADGTYQLGNVDLLTLSACYTGMDPGAVDGVAVEGLATKAQFIGARSVLATLWSIADGSTAVFMQSFYQLRRDRGLTKAEALRYAQLKFITAELNPAILPSELRTNQYANALMPNYQHPFFWGAFILLGNWL